VREDQNLVPENPGTGVEASNPPMARWAGASCTMENLIQIFPPCLCLQTKFVRMRISRCFSLISAGDFIALRELASCHSWIFSFSVMEFIAAVSTCSVLPRSVCVKFQFSFNLLKGALEAVICVFSWLAVKCEMRPGSDCFQDLCERLLVELHSTNELPLHGN
jgi:hypothetical protein